MFICEYFVLLLQVRAMRQFSHVVFAVDSTDTVARTRSYGRDP